MQPICIRKIIKKMPSNKEAFIRYRAINRCLINGKVVSKEKLIDACSEATSHDVSWRTIAEDIRVMRQDDGLGFHAPIENVVNQGYRYTRDDYSIDNIPLNNEEVDSLGFAARLLEQYRDVGIFSTFSGAVQKLSQKLSIKLQSDEHDIDKVIDFESSTSDGGSTLIDPLMTHIRQKTVLNIRYYSFSSGRESVHTVHPYFLKEYRNRWYLLGWHETYKQMRTLALERIISLEPEYSIVFEKKSFDPAKYYANAIGVSVNNSDVINAKLKVVAREWPYIESQPWHHSMHIIEESKDHVIFGLHLIVNYEFKNLILSFGSGIEVLGPQSLRSEIARDFLRSAEVYKGDQS